jgi:hypothetical protein
VRQHTTKHLIEGKTIRNQPIAKVGIVLTLVNFNIYLPKHAAKLTFNHCSSPVNTHTSVVSKMIGLRAA